MYQLTADEYRRQFRLSKKQDGESFRQFATRLNVLLERWRKAADKDEIYAAIVDLLLQEQLLETLSGDLAMHVRLGKPGDVFRAAESAERYVESRRAGRCPANVPLRASQASKSSGPRADELVVDRAFVGKIGPEAATRKNQGEKAASKPLKVVDSLLGDVTREELVRLQAEDPNLAKIRELAKAGQPSPSGKKGTEQNEEVRTTAEYAVDLRHRLEETCKMAQENLMQVSRRYAKHFDRRAVPRKFPVGIKVLLLLPVKDNKLEMAWQGPYETPSGRQSSSKYQDGRFYLQLPNPVEGGEYSCILPSTDPATSCLPDGSLLEAALVVDEMQVRLTLLEAENTDMKAAVKDLKAENTDMNAAVKDLKAENTDMKAAVKDLKAENTDMNAAVKDLKAENTDMNAAVKDVKALVNINTATLDSLLFTVAFTATLQGKGHVTIGNNSPIKFDNVVTNIGNAYNSHTGVFTAPVSGTYGFFLSLKGANIPSP
nr:hypothetical protein BaRGS_002378 [Batillaria attramentaria]